ncbi:MAG: efflux RND transporter periplasmic adaptor subunit, partial [Gemmatimonadales bacterium]
MKHVTLLLLIVLAACGEKELPPLYQAVPVSIRDIVVSANAAGSIEPITTVEVKSKASGEITEVTVEIGDAVRAGQRLVRVDRRVPQNALTQAEADLEVARAQLTNAQSQLRRAEGLHQTQSITEQEYENARLQTANANAQLVRAQRSLEDARIASEDTEVRAPINGIIIGRTVEVGSVISSATSNVSGGTTLLRMANLDTVQIRSLVDETDIGKIQPGMPVTIRVDAYPNRPFRGEVLKIEPQAVTQQNVTMFPVLVRILNTESLLKPGMNAEVEVHIGNRAGVLAVPNAALRTQRDVGSAALVVGLDPDAVTRQLAAARQAAQGDSGRASLGGVTTTDTVVPAGMWRNPRDGRVVRLPNGVTATQMNAIMTRVSNGGFQTLSANERSIMQRVMSAAGGPNARGARPQGNNNDAMFGGQYIVFVLRNGQPTPVEVRTGLTDLDYSEVRSGLLATDTVLLLPSASLIQSQAEFAERLQRMTGQGLPG